MSSAVADPSKAQHAHAMDVQAEPRDVTDDEPDGPTPASPRGDRDFAIVVGVEHYKHIRKLCGPHRDATAFHTWLCETDGGGLDEKDTTLILSDRDASTSHQVDIDERLDEMLRAACEGGGARRLYFYFAGHGATDDRLDDDVALLLARWSKRMAKIALSAQGYSTFLRRARSFGEIVILVDCCRTFWPLAIGREPLITAVCQALPSDARTFIAFATQDGEPAFEVCKPGEVIKPCGVVKPGETGPHDGWSGIFTQCLLSLLRGSPGGARARVLQDQLESAVEVEAKARGLFQRARVITDFHCDSIFGRGGSLPILVLRFAKRRGRVVLKDGDLRERFNHQADDQLWEIPLRMGLYQIEGGGEESVTVRHDGRKDPHDV